MVHDLDASRPATSLFSVGENAVVALASRLEHRINFFEVVSSIRPVRAFFCASIRPVRAFFMK